MRRAFLFLLAISLPASAPAQIPLSGTPVPGMESADRAYAEFMKKHGIPGGSVAIMKNGRLVYARGFGWANREKNVQVQPAHLFRIASLSKPITAMVVADLVEQGKFSYDTKAFPYLRYATPNYKGAKRDPRLDSITVRHLLQHSGGWDRDTARNPDGKKGFDPMFYPNAATKDLTSVSYPPADAGRVARWMVGKPLQFDPGTRYAYSNYGYCVLGRMIEKATGQSYEAYTKSLLKKAGVTRMFIGGSRERELFQSESRYYDFPGARRDRSVFGEDDTAGPHRFSISTLDAHGGWIATPTDLLRFTTLFDQRPDPADLLESTSIRLMRARPSFAQSAKKQSNYYGLGWSFFEKPDRKFRNWFHSGSLPGTMAMLIRSDNGVTWAALFNMRPKDRGAAFKDLDATMWKAIRGVKTWP